MARESKAPWKQLVSHIHEQEAENNHLWSLGNGAAHSRQVFLPQLVQSRQSPRGKVILDSVKLAVNTTITHRHRVSGLARDRHVFFHWASPQVVVYFKIPTYCICLSVFCNGTVYLYIPRKHRKQFVMSCPCWGLEMGSERRCQKFQISQVAGSNALSLLLLPLFVVGVLCHDLLRTQLFTHYLSRGSLCLSWAHLRPLGPVLQWVGSSVIDGIILNKSSGSPERGSYWLMSPLL